MLCGLEKNSTLLLKDIKVFNFYRSMRIRLNQLCSLGGGFLVSRIKVVYGMFFPSQLNLYVFYNLRSTKAYKNLWSILVPSKPVMIGNPLNDTCTALVKTEKNNRPSIL